MVNFLKVLFGVIFVWMCYKVISTCISNNLFTEWDYLGQIPWMKATLWDFYANVTVIFVWLCYKESKLWVKFIWLILLVTLGSIASCAYMLVQLFKLKSGEGLKELFGKKMDNTSLLTLVIYSVATCCIIMALVWLWSYKIGNAGVVDIFWSYNFPVIAIILFLFAPAFEARKLLLCGMVIIAGLRLGTHLAIRIFKHLRQEEPRYKQIRDDWGKNADKKMFGFFQMQALSNVLLAIPFFISAMNTSPELSPLEYAGAVLWVVSVGGEAIADKQLANFKKNPDNKGKVCDTGLWNYSRHPNYFFEWLMWVSYFVFALGSPYGYLAVISPAIILYLLLKVTGIPTTEQQSLKSRPLAYKKYQETTSKFVPWFKGPSKSPQ